MIGPVCPHITVWWRRSVNIPKLRQWLRVSEASSDRNESVKVQHVSLPF